MRLSRARALFVAGVVLATLTLVLLVGFRTWDRLCGNHPIMFYGQVLDQNGTGIPGVEVEFQIRYSDRVMLPYTYGRTERIRRLTLLSDGNGDFQLTGISGYGFSITDFRLNGRSLNWAFPPPDSRNPRQTYTYEERNSRATIPETPSRRARYPLSPR